MTATRDPERGSVLVVVLVILVALLAGGGVALYVQLGNTRSTGLVRFARAALFCAEGGLQASRQKIIDGYPDWNQILDSQANGTGNWPAWYAADMDCDGTAETPGKLAGDLGDGGDCPDWEVWIEDNHDEFAGAPAPVPNPGQDNDLHVFAYSKCLMFDETQPRTVAELWSYDVGGENNASSGGGAQGTGNRQGVR